MSINNDKPSTKLTSPASQLATSTIAHPLQSGKALTAPLSSFSPPHPHSSIKIATKIKATAPAPTAATGDSDDNHGKAAVQPLAGVARFDPGDHAKKIVVPGVARFDPGDHHVIAPPSLPGAAQSAVTTVANDSTSENSDDGDGKAQVVQPLPGVARFDPGDHAKKVAVPGVARFDPGDHHVVIPPSIPGPTEPATKGVTSGNGDSGDGEAAAQPLPGVARFDPGDHAKKIVVPGVARFDPGDHHVVVPPSLLGFAASAATAATGDSTSGVSDGGDGNVAVQSLPGVARFDPGDHAKKIVVPGVARFDPGDHHVAIPPSSSNFAKQIVTGATNNSSDSNAKSTVQSLPGVARFDPGDHAKKIATPGVARFDPGDHHVVPSLPSTANPIITTATDGSASGESDAGDRKATVTPLPGVARFDPGDHAKKVVVPGVARFDPGDHHVVLPKPQGQTQTQTVESPQPSPSYYALVERSLDDQVLMVYDVETGKLLSRWAGSTSTSLSGLSSSSSMRTVECLEWAWVPVVPAGNEEGGNDGEAQKGNNEEVKTPTAGGVQGSPSSVADYKLVILIGLGSGDSKEGARKDLIVLDPVTGLELTASSHNLSPSSSPASARGILSLAALPPSFTNPTVAILLTSHLSPSIVRAWSLSLQPSVPSTNSPPFIVSLSLLAHISIPPTSQTSAPISWTAITAQYFSQTIPQDTILLALATTSAAYTFTVASLLLFSQSQPSGTTEASLNVSDVPSVTTAAPTIEAHPLATSPANFGNLSSTRPPTLAFVDLTTDESSQERKQKLGLVTAPRGGDGQDDEGDVKLWGPLPFGPTADIAAQPTVALSLLANLSLKSEKVIIEQASVVRCTVPSLDGGGSAAATNTTEAGLLWVVLTSPITSTAVLAAVPTKVIASQTSLRSLFPILSASASSEKATNSEPVVLYKQGETSSGTIGGLGLDATSGDTWIAMGGGAGGVRFTEVNLRDSEKRLIKKIQLE